MSNPGVFIFMALVVSAFLAYGHAVRRGFLEGRQILLVGLGIGIVAVGSTVALLYPVVGRGAHPAYLIVNGGAMALSTAYCVLFAYRQARVEDVFERQFEATRVVVRACSPWRLRGADIALVPTTTRLQTLGGPAAAVMLAAGREAEREAAKLSPIPLEKVVVLPAGRLRVGQIFPVAVHEPLKPVEAGRLRRGMSNAGLLARKAGGRKILVPFSPFRGLPTAEAAEAMVTGVLKHRKHFDEVVFVALDGRGTRELTGAIEKIEEG